MSTKSKKTSRKKRTTKRRKRNGLGNLGNGQVLYVAGGNGYHGDSDLKWRLVGYTLLASAIGAGAFFGYRWYKGKLQGKVEEKSLSIGNPENYAMHLKKAFDNDGWPGTNNDEVFKTFEEMPSYAAYTAMTKAYAQLTGNIFEHDLDDEMSLKEIRKIEDILKTKHDAPKSISVSSSKK